MIIKRIRVGFAVVFFVVCVIAILQLFLSRIDPFIRDLTIASLLYTATMLGLLSWGIGTLVTSLVNSILVFNIGIDLTNSLNTEPAPIKLEEENSLLMICTCCDSLMRVTKDNVHIGYSVTEEADFYTKVTINAPCLTCKTSHTIIFDKA